MNVVTGKVKCLRTDLDLPLTLLGGQSFRWKQIKPTEESSSNGEQSNIQLTFIGVANNILWEIKHTFNDYFEYKAHKSILTKNWNEKNCEEFLINYFNLNFNINELIKKWKLSNEHFNSISSKYSSVRLLNQETFENLISFICSQNNNIERITKMIEWLCKNYGIKITTINSNDYYTFPTLEKLYNIENLENELYNAKFGYRSKYIKKAIEQIWNNGGNEWFKNLKNLSYINAKNELIKIYGIGNKVADCICLMSLNHYEAVPVDIHIFKIAKEHYYFNKITENNDNNIEKIDKIKRKIPKNNKQYMNPALYDKIADTFRYIYSPYAGWAQLVLFCSDLKKFQDKN